MRRGNPHRGIPPQKTFWFMSDHVFWHISLQPETLASTPLTDCFAAQIAALDTYVRARQRETRVGRLAGSLT